MKEIRFVFNDTGEWAYTKYEDGSVWESKRYRDLVKLVAERKDESLKQKDKRFKENLKQRLEKFIKISEGNRGRKPKKLSLEQVGEVRRLNSEGQSLRKIGEKFGVSHQTVKRYLQEE